MPLKTSLVAIVTINGNNLSFAAMTPLKVPMKNPSATAQTNASQMGGKISWPISLIASVPSEADIPRRIRKNHHATSRETNINVAVRPSGTPKKATIADAEARSPKAKVITNKITEISPSVP